MSKISLAQQSSALRHAVSVLSHEQPDGTRAMSEPALSWLRACLVTIEWLEKNDLFARALVKIIDLTEDLGGVDWTINIKSDKDTKA